MKNFLFNKKIFAVIAAVMLVSMSFCGVVSASEFPVGYTVTEIGQINYDGNDYKVDYSGALNYHAANKTGEYYVQYICDYLGNRILDEGLLNIEGISETCFAVTADSDDINRTGLVTVDGEVLIPCEAAIIKAVVNEDYPDIPVRYVEVIYSTGQTDNINEAFFYVTDHLELFQQPTDDDIPYAGYAKIYDLETKKFVGDIIVDNNSKDAVKDCGDYVAVEGLDGNIRIYDADGKETMCIQDRPVEYYGNNYVVVNENGYCVYDAGTGEESFFINSGALCYYYRDYIYVNDFSADIKQVLDKSGNIIIDNIRLVYNINNGIIEAEDENDNKILMDIDTGKIIHQMEDSEWDYYNIIKYGYYYYEKEDLTVVAPDGSECVAEDKSNMYNLVIGRETDSGTEYYVFNDKDYTLKLDNAGTSLTYGMLACMQDGKYGVYDLFTGDLIVPFNYVDVQYGAGYIYAYDEHGVITVYKADLQFE